MSLFWNTVPSQPTSVLPPAWETNGDYRLAVINATTELPCTQAFDVQRTGKGLSAVIEDEWSLESARAIMSAQQHPSGSGTMKPITTGNTFSFGGGTCTQMFAISFAGVNPATTDARTRWFGGGYVIYQNGNQGVGDAQFPIDPASFTTRTFRYGRR